MPAITSVHPLRAVEGGRITILGSDFSVDDVTTVQIGDTAARVAFASPSRLVVIIPADLEGGRAAMKVPGVTLETAYVTIGTRWATGLAPGRQPRIRSSGQSFRHLQRAAWPGSSGIDIPRHARRDPRAVFVGNRKRDFARLRPGRTPLCLEPLRRRRIPNQRRRFA